jgi:hypothetical protein
MFPEASKVLRGGPYKFGADVRASSPCYLVDAALRGHIVGEDQDKIVDDFDSIDMKSNTLVGKIGDEAKARRDANPEFDGSQPAQTMTRGPASFINIQRTHTVRLRVMALPMAQGLSQGKYVPKAICRRPNWLARIYLVFSIKAWVPTFQNASPCLGCGLLRQLYLNPARTRLS